MRTIGYLLGVTKKVPTQSSDFHPIQPTPHLLVLWGWSIASQDIIAAGRVVQGLAGIMLMKMCARVSLTVE